MMASSKLDTVVSDEVECAICLNRLHAPRMLSCLHSFCEMCLQKYVDQKDMAGSIVCPVCKSTTGLPETGVSGLRLDFRANKLVEALLENEKCVQKLSISTHHCEACGFQDGGTNFTFCRECCQVLCQRCSSAHAGLRMTQDHAVANISDLLHGKVTFPRKEQYSICPKHRDEKLKLFCVTCSEMICPNCTLIDHTRDKGHNFQFLSEFSDTIRTELECRLNNVSRKVEEYDTFIKSIDSLNSHIAERGKAIEKAIQSNAKDHKISVEQMVDLMINEQGTYFSEREKELIDMKHKTEQMKAFAEKSSVMTKNVLENRQDNIGVASMCKSLLEAMDRVTGENPENEQFNKIKESVSKLHFHAFPPEEKVGKIIAECNCDERHTLFIPCTNGPQCVQFTRDGKLAIVQLETKGQPLGRGIQTTRNNALLTQTAVNYPFCTSFNWNRRLDPLRYDQIICFATLSDQRYVIATTDARLHLLADNLTDLSHGLPDNRSISGLATDIEDTIYVTDGEYRRIVILRADGSLRNTITTGDFSPSGVTVSLRHPKRIVITHKPANVSVLDLQGNVMCSIHHNDWQHIAIGTDDKSIYILWSNGNSEMTLDRYSFRGTKNDTLFEKKRYNSTWSHVGVRTTFKNLLAVYRTGIVAVATQFGQNGQILTMSAPPS